MGIKNSIMNGARLVGRHFRLVVWIFVVNFALAWLGAWPVRNSFGSMLDHSLASEHLVHGFDMMQMFELVRGPEIQLRGLAMNSIHFSLIFLLYMIFINGGVLTVYREDRRLTKAEFFEMSGGYFWRNVRLVLLSFIPFAILAGIFSSLSEWSDRLTDDATNARTGFWVLTVSCIVLWIVSLFVRAWFDVAQSLTVANNERGMLRTAGRGLMITGRNLGSLLASYAPIHLVGIVATVALFTATLYIPHASFRMSFFVLEIAVLINIGVRLWQKAACMWWLENRPVAVMPPYEQRAEIVAPVQTMPEQI